MAEQTGGGQRKFTMNFSEKLDEVSREDWLERLQSLHITRVDMNRLIVDYFLTEGFKEAAEKFHKESGTKPTTDSDTLDERIKIRGAIEHGKIADAIFLVNNLHPELLDNDKYLFFHLQQQHLIELIRNRKTEKALDFAQTHLAEKAEENPEILAELERTLALLAFEDPENSPFGELLHPSHRQKVASELNSAILQMENKESTPKLAKMLKLLLWAQDELDTKKVKYPKMTDLATGEIEEPKS